MVPRLPGDPGPQVRGHARAAEEGGRAGPAGHRDPRGVRRPGPRQGLAAASPPRRRRATAASPSPSWATPASAPCPSSTSAPRSRRRSTCPSSPPASGSAPTRCPRPRSATDAMNAKARAVLSPDGKSWILNGEKMWLTNAGFADVYITFAKVDGEHFTAFIIDKGTPGRVAWAPRRRRPASRAAPRGRSSCRTRCIPKENLLGEIGKGHKIAFNILNIGRFKLGAGVTGGAKLAIAQARRVREGAHRLRPARSPTSAWSSTSSARWRSCAYVSESMVYRTAGHDRPQPGRRRASTTRPRP